MTREDKVKNFNTLFCQPVNKPLSLDLLDLSHTLLLEEFVEFQQEVSNIHSLIKSGMEVTKEDKVKFLKELTDVQYIVSWIATVFGLRLDEAFDLVHASNLSKLGEDGKPIFRDDGKVLKGPNYKVADLSALFE